MSVYEKISGFADEISQDFDQQLKTVTDLGMKYICIRSAEHKGIADYTPEEVRTVFCRSCRPQVWAFPSLGTAIGKVEVDDEEALPSSWSSWKHFAKRPSSWTAPSSGCSASSSPRMPMQTAIPMWCWISCSQFIRIAEKHDVVLLHENEKGIYGDTGARCKLLFDRLAAPTSRRRSILPTLFSVSRTPRSVGNCSMTRSLISTSRMLCPAAC